MNDDFAWMDATAQADLVRKGEVTPTELVEAAIARIDKLNPQLNAVIHRLDDKATAAAADPALPDGPFRGVPFLVKDGVCHTAGDPFHCGMQVLKDLDWHEDTDTWLAQRYRGRWLRVRRQDQPARARSLGHDGAPRVRRDAQPLEPRSLAGRVERGRRGRGRRRDRARRPRQRHGRLDPYPVERVRARRPQAHSRPHDPRPRLRRVLGAAHPRARADTQRARHALRVLDAVAGPGPGDPYTAPPPAAAVRRTRSAPIPGGCGSGSARCAPTASSRTPSASPRSTRRPRALERARPRGRAGSPRRARRRRTPGSSGSIASAIARDLERWGVRTGRTLAPADVEPMNAVIAEMGAGDHRAAILGRDRDGSCARPAGRIVVGRPGTMCS